VTPTIFREYDIRGRVPEELNRDTAYRLGQCFGAYYQGVGAKRISLGRDCRLSSQELRQGVVQGMMDAGIDVIDAGMVPTPLLYFSLHHLDVDGGVQITGSHNPPEYNGFKICLGKTTIYGEEIQKLRRIADKGSFPKGKGSTESEAVIEPYLEEILKRIRCGQVRRKVVLDAGNGVAGLVAPDLYRRMGVEVEKLFCEPDGRFPNHHPDPTLPENLKPLVEKVIDTSADLGIAFDGDADRIGVVDRKGRILWGDQLMIIFSRDLLKRHPGAKIIGEVKCSQVLYDDIRKNGGIPIMWKAGHSLIKAKMKDEAALLAGEMSGHLFFADRYFGFDDAIYAGARLLEILTNENKDLQELLAGVPTPVNTPEIRLECPDDLKFQVVADLASEFKKEYQVIDVDGARVVLNGGWGLIRASNTQPVLVLRFEAADQKTLQKIRKIFMDKLAKKGLRVQ
jgi:phosphomannomutase/phosphoglucomutase